MADRPAPESCECKVVGSFDRGTGRNCYDRDPSACRYPETLEALRKAEEERDFLAMLRAGDISLVAAVTQEADAAYSTFERQAQGGATSRDGLRLPDGD